MGAEGIVAVMYKGRISRAKSPEEAEEIRREGIEKVKAALETFTYTGLDNIIDPRQTRPAIIKALKCLANKKLERPQRKHENINM
jgi:propionyl-CoA carboxylase beta chain